MSRRPRPNILTDSSLPAAQPDPGPTSSSSSSSSSWRSALAGTLLAGAMTVGAHALDCGGPWDVPCMECCETLFGVCIFYCPTCDPGTVPIGLVCVPESAIDAALACALNPCQSGCLPECNPLCAQFDPFACLCGEGMGLDPVPFGSCNSCWLGSPTWECIGDGRGQLGEQAWKPGGVEFLRSHGLRRCDHGLGITDVIDCFFHGDCECQNVTRFSPEVDAWYQGTWESLAIRKWQRMITESMPLTQHFMLGSHNSYNTAADGYLTYQHTYSLSDQLRLGVRYLTLDVHWWPLFDPAPTTDLRLAHAKYIEANIPGLLLEELHLGMTWADRGFRFALEEIRMWMDENPLEVVIIDIENWSEGQDDQILEPLNRIFGEILFRPSEFQSAFNGLWANVTPDQLVPGQGGFGRLIVICKHLGAGQDTCHTDVSFPSYPNNSANAFLASYQFNPATGYAGSGTPWGSNDDHLRMDQISEFYSDSYYFPATPANDEWDGPEDVGLITPDVLRTMIKAGVNVVTLDPIGASAAGFPKYSPNDNYQSPWELAAASIWSWEQGEPSGPGSVGIARINPATGALRFRSEAPSGGPARPFAMQSANGCCWTVSSTASTHWSDSFQVPEGAIGYYFRCPGNGYEMERLRLAMIDAGVNEVWVHLYYAGFQDADGYPWWSAYTVAQDPTYVPPGLVVAGDDAYDLSSPSESLVVAAPGVLADDRAMTVHCVSMPLFATTEGCAPPSFGTVTMHADGGFTYTPGPDFPGTDSFGYRTWYPNDPNILSAEAEVAIGGDFPTNHYYVSPEGNDAGDGLTIATAKKSVQAVLDAAPPGGVKITLAPGEHVGSVIINRSPVTIQGSMSGMSVLTTHGSGRVVTVNGGMNAVLKDLTISNGRGGLFLQIGAKALVNRCVISDNTCNTIEQVGAGIRSLGNLTLRNSTIRNNHQTAAGAVNFVGVGGVCATPITTVISCTISDNQVSGNIQQKIAGAAGPTGGNGPVLVNSIVAANDGEDIHPGVHSNGYNIIGNGAFADAKPTDLLFTDPLLGAWSALDAERVLYPDAFTMTGSGIPATALHEAAGEPDGVAVYLAANVISYTLTGGDPLSHAADGPGADLFVYVSDSIPNPAFIKVRVREHPGSPAVEITGVLTLVTDLPSDDGGAVGPAFAYDFADAGLAEVRVITIEGVTTLFPMHLDAVALRYGKVHQWTSGRMPLAESPAIDSGIPVSLLDRDQRGATRPMDGSGGGIALMDRGALERPQGSPTTLGDLNGDGLVNGADLGLLLSQWGPCLRGGACTADLNGDGLVNGADLGILLSNWG